MCDESVLHVLEVLNVDDGLGLPEGVHRPVRVFQRSDVLVQILDGKLKEGFFVGIMLPA